MFVAGNFVAAVAQVVNVLLTAYTWIIIIRVLSSWLSPDPSNLIVIFLHRATDPVLEPLRRVIPPLGFMDLSPMVALIILQAMQIFLVRTLFDLSLRLR